MLAKSFHSVGLNEILAAVKVPKGSFYHHFESKEQFGVEMLRHYLDQATRWQEEWLGNKMQFPDPAERLIAHLEAGMAKFLENGCRAACLAVKLVGEVATFSDGMRKELADGFARRVSVFEAVIREGQACGTIKKSLEPKPAAALLNDIWLGATLRAQAMQNVAPLREIIAFLRKYLLA